MPVVRRLLVPAIVCLATVGPLAGQGVHRGLDPENLDTSCAPCQDFYRYANGGWLARTELPPEYPSYGSFTELVERNNQTLRGIVDRLAAGAPATPKTTDQKLGAFYASCMDSARAERAGAQPLKNELDRIAAIASPADLARTLARGHHHGWDPLFNLNGTPDFKNSTSSIAAASQGGLGLPDRDYYLRSDSTARALRAAYVEYVSRTLALLGVAPAAADSEAQRILALETALARASLTRVERRDPNANYHKMPLAAADSVTPHLAWAALLRDAGAPATDSINIAQPRFFHAADSLMTAVPLGDWRAYLRWHFASHLAPWLSSPFVDASFQFQRALIGVKEQQPRWKRCLQAANAMMGDAIGQAYVKQTFTADARRRALRMVDDLIAALDEGVAHDRSHRQRLVQLVLQRHHVPGGDPPGAVLRSRGGRRGELRRHGRRDRPRDDPRLRRSGPPVRRRGQPARLVDPRRRPALQRARGARGETVRRLHRG
ncbi:MAG: hypothetical protein DMD56_04680 [Gemmatimonadetes bacterium]|nr:MAG: hypothetical protein DMD56_04680 [Gemmatimonadota bacterium]